METRKLRIIASGQVQQTQAAETLTALQNAHPILNAMTAIQQQQMCVREQGAARPHATI